MSAVGPGPPRSRAEAPAVSSPFGAPTGPVHRTGREPGCPPPLSRPRGPWRSPSWRFSRRGPGTARQPSCWTPNPRRAVQGSWGAHGWGAADAVCSSPSRPRQSFTPNAPFVPLLQVRSGVGGRGGGRKETPLVTTRFGHCRDGRMSPADSGTEGQSAAAEGLRRKGRIV